jgi:hypothetical protein
MGFQGLEICTKPGFRTANSDLPPLTMWRNLATPLAGDHNGPGDPLVTFTSLLRSSMGQTSSYTVLNDNFITRPVAKRHTSKVEIASSISPTRGPTKG